MTKHLRKRSRTTRAKKSARSKSTRSRSTKAGSTRKKRAHTARKRKMSFFSLFE